MIVRLVWYCSLVALAVVTVAVQLDRQSAVAPAFADLTPSPARGFAQAQIAARAFEGENAEFAVDQAKLLVNRRPMPAEPLRLLAQSQLKAGQTDEALVTIQIAAQRGWRDRAAQEAVLRLALAAGDEAEAAKRYTALFLGRSTEDAFLQEFGTQLFEERDGIAAQTFADLLVGSERRRSTFLARGARVIPSQPFVAIVRNAADRGTQFDCELLERATAAVKARDQAAGSELQATFAEVC